MAISIQCGSCFQDFKVKDELAGKSVKCRECGASIRVSRERSRPNAKATVADDEYEDYGDPIEEEIAPRIVRSKSSKKKKRRSGGAGRFLNAALPIVGKIAWVWGIFLLISWIPIVLGVGFLFGLLAAGIASIAPLLIYFGMKGAGGKGIPVSSDTAIDGNTGIVVGIVMILLGNSFPWIALQIANQGGMAIPRAQFDNNRPKDSQKENPPPFERPASGTPEPKQQRPQVVESSPVGDRRNLQQVELGVVAYRGTGKIAEAAQQSLGSVPEIVPSSVEFDDASRRLRFHIRGGSLNMKPIYTALEKAGFEIRGFSLSPVSP